METLNYEVLAKSGYQMNAIFNGSGKGSWAKSTAAAMMMNGAQNTLSATVPIVRLWVYGKKTDVSANILHFPLKIFLKYPTL